MIPLGKSEIWRHRRWRLNLLSAVCIGRLHSDLPRANNPTATLETEILMADRDQERNATDVMLQAGISSQDIASVDVELLLLSHRLSWSNAVYMSLANAWKSIHRVHFGAGLSLSECVKGRSDMHTHASPLRYISRVPSNFQT